MIPLYTALAVLRPKIDITMTLDVFDSPIYCVSGTETSTIDLYVLILPIPLYTALAVLTAR